MALDPSIILAGQNPNILAALDAGTMAGQRTNQARRDTQLQQLYAQHGAGIAQGQQPALNALAGFDPSLAMNAQSNQLGMQQTRQNMAFDAEAMQMKRAEVKQQARAEAGRLSAEQRAQEAAKIERGLAAAGMAYQKGDRAAYDAFLAQNGIDPATMPFDQFPMHAAQYSGVLDALKEAGDVFSPAQSGERFKVVGSQLIDLQAEGGPKAVISTPGQTETVFGPDGQPILTRGPTPTGKPLTEGQSKDVGFSARARGALNVLEPIAGSLTSRPDILLDKLPMGVGREMQGDDYQVASNAARNLLLAILRKDTGAAVTPTEEQMYGEVFLPQPGDGAALLAQKAQARELAVAGLEQGMPADAILAQGRALMQATGGAAGGSSLPPQAPQLNLADPEVDALLQKYRAP